MRDRLGAPRLEALLLEALLVPAVAAPVLFTPSLARAYCPTYTCEFDPLVGCGIDPESGCSRGGEIAHWADGCLTYAVQAQGSPKLSITAEELRRVLEAGFVSWSDAVCEGRGPGVMTTSSSPPTRARSAPARTT